MRYDAVIFDLDGLLLDTERLAIDAGMTALAGLGHRVGADVMRSLVGTDNRAGLRALRAHLGADLDEDALDRAWGLEMEALVLDGVPLKPGALQLLDRLDRLALPYAVATNSQRATARTKIAASALLGRLGTVVTFDDVPRGKPAPDVYLEAARRLGIAPARAIAFEDSDPGVLAARAAGLTVVQVPDLLAPDPARAHHTAATLLAGTRWAGLVPQDRATQ